MCVVCAISLISPAMAQPRYRVEDKGASGDVTTPVDEYGTYLRGINNLGEAVGYSRYKAPGKIGEKVIRTTTTAAFEDITSKFGTGLTGRGYATNDRGAVVAGYSRLSSSITSDIALLNPDGSVRSLLATPFSLTRDMVIRRITNSGYVIGFERKSDSGETIGLPRMALPGGTLNLFPGFNNLSSAFPMGINESGSAVGFSSIGWNGEARPLNPYAWYRRGGQFIPFDFEQDGTTFTDVNDQEIICGTSEALVEVPGGGLRLQYTPYFLNGITKQRTMFTPIEPDVPFLFEDINNLNVAIGNSASIPKISHGTTMITLQSTLDAQDNADWQLLGVSQINDRNQIAGWAKRKNSPYIHGVILQPVPEPATLAALSLGAAVLLRRRRR
jgi:hypothetical protein